MGTQDEPAFIDFILDKTGYSKLAYIGHSVGGTMLMAGGALMPDYFNEKIQVSVFLAPVASMYYN